MLFQLQGLGGDKVIHKVCVRAMEEGTAQIIKNDYQE